MFHMPNSQNIVLKVADFGPIAKANVELRPLTVFVGPSNTGKSYLAILIYALHKFMNRILFFSSSGLYGYGRKGYIARNIRNTDISAVLQQWGITQATEEKLIAWVKEIHAKERMDDLEDVSETSIPEFIAQIVRPLLSNVEELAPDIAEEIMRCFGVDEVKDLIRHESKTRLQVSIQRPCLESASSAEPFEYKIKMGKRKHDFSAIFPENAPLSIRTRNVVEAWPIMGLEDSYLSAMKDNDLNQKNSALLYFIEYMCEFIASNVFHPLSSEAYYLPADRTGIMHAHRVVVGSLISNSSRAGFRRTTPLPPLSGVLADFLEQLVSLDSRPRIRQRFNRRIGSNTRHIAQRLEAKILKGSIQQKSTPTGYPIFSYQPDGWQNEIQLQNASSMVSEIAPVVLYLRHIVKPGEVLIIEEPESHLHPELQVEFMRQLATAVRSGIRIIITTHSEWLLDVLANSVHLSDLDSNQKRDDEAERMLSPDQVGVWRFHPKRRPRGSEVREIELNREYGSFPSGYGDVADDTYNEYVDISNRIEQDASP